MDASCMYEDKKQILDFGEKGAEMEKEVLICVKGIHAMDENGERVPIEMVVPGEYYFRNGSHYLRYEEILEDSGEPTVNYVKISDKGLEVRKKGLVNVHMVFEPGKRNVSYYTTPFGTLKMGICATGVDVEQQENTLRVKANYSLDMNEEHASDCSLMIEAKQRISFDKR